jgi:hypothetical protein
MVMTYSAVKTTCACQLSIAVLPIISKLSGFKQRFIISHSFVGWLDLVRWFFFPHVVTEVTYTACVSVHPRHYCSTFNEGFAGTRRSKINLSIYLSIYLSIIYLSII